jgi:hypothetical protein
MSHIYIIYQITNKVNEKFYIGLHKTKNVNDGYFGSGIAIKAAIEKYGIKNFEKTILHVFHDSKQAREKEIEIVTEELVKNPMCYNLTVGGYGGFHYIRAENKHKLNKGKKVIHSKNLNATARVSPDVLPKYLELGWEMGFLPESLQKMSESGKVKIQSEKHRSKNSETKTETSILEHIETGKRKFIKKEIIQDYINDGWRLLDSGKKNRGKIMIHNLKLNKIIRIDPADFEKYSKQGWKKGFLPRKR